MTDKATPLKNPKYELFAQGLAKGEYADTAYVNAGYAENRGNAATLKANQIIVDRVAEIVAEGAEEAKIEVADVLKELGRVGFSDIRKLFKENGEIVQPADMDDETAAFVSSIEVVANKKGDETEHVHKIKMWDKLSALEKLAKHLGMFVDRIEHTGKDGEALIPETSDAELARRMAFMLAKGGDVSS